MKINLKETPKKAKRCETCADYINASRGEGDCVHLTAALKKLAPNVRGGRARVLFDGTCGDWRPGVDQTPNPDQDERNGNAGRQAEAADFALDQAKDRALERAAARAGVPVWGLNLDPARSMKLAALVQKFIVAVNDAVHGPVFKPTASDQHPDPRCGACANCDTTNCMAGLGRCANMTERLHDLGFPFGEDSGIIVSLGTRCPNCPDFRLSEDAEAEMDEETRYVRERRGGR